MVENIASSSLATEKESLEVKKLQTEIEQLQDQLQRSRLPVWKDLRIAGPVAAFVLSVVGNVVQYNDKRVELQNQRLQLDATISKISVENEKMKSENESMKQRIGIVANVEKLKTVYFDELEKIKRDAAVWDKAIFENQMQLELARSKESSFEFDSEKKNGPLHIAAKQNVGLLERSLTMRKAELEAARARQRELELIIFKGN